MPALLYVVLPYLLIALSLYTFKRAWDHRLWWDAAFAAANVGLGTYAIVAFIGIRASIVDIWVNVVSWLYKPATSAPKPSRRAGPAPVAREAQVRDWESVLYLGSSEARAGAGRPASANGHPGEPSRRAAERRVEQEPGAVGA